ncbi:histidine phosphatase family protein [Glaciecola sp. SC05]|uniref:histidine phosphatase family protein n=1 Tax=Glaciecola sp. SC05 TaxID=1987355 RepID=UPI0035299390
MWIYLIRHGETDGNRNRIVQTPDTPLSKIGLLQAEYLAKAYAHLPATHILCSDYARTKATAAPLHKRLNCELSYTELLRERNFGDLRGQAYDEIGHDFFAQDYNPPNGESYSQFVGRVRRAWRHVVNQANSKDGDLVVMTHGLVLRCLLTEILSIAPAKLEHSDIKNTCVTKISRSDPSDIPLLCNANHLADEAFSAGNQGAV